MAPEDYFSLFDLPHYLHLDVAGLERNFYALSRRLHPDRFITRSSQEQQAALQRSSFLNDAYRTLRDPILRTRYLLKLEGASLDEQSKAATDAARSNGTEKKQLIPEEILEEVFELNMQLAEMKEARQAGQDDPELRRALEGSRSQFNGKLDANQKALEQLWVRWDRAEADNALEQKEAAKAEMLNLLNQRSYIANLIREVNDSLAEAA